MWSDYDIIYCSNCFAGWNIAPFWANYLYVLPDHSTEWIPHSLGWCYDCSTVSVIEDFDLTASHARLETLTKELAELDGELSKLSDESYRHPLDGSGMASFGAAKWLGLEHFERAEEKYRLEKYLRFCAALKRAPQCLGCRGKSILPIALPALPCEPWESCAERLSLNMEHPECGVGCLWIKRRDRPAFINQGTRFYTPDGELVEEREATERFPEDSDIVS